MKFILPKRKTFLAYGLMGVSFMSSQILYAENEMAAGNTGVFKATGVVSDNFLFKTTFCESDLLSGLRKQFAKQHSLNVGESPGLESDLFGRIEFREDDNATSSGIRAEILFPLQEHPERWYSHSIYFSENGHDKDSKTEIISQLPRAYAGSPPIAIQGKDNLLYLNNVKEGFFPSWVLI